MCQLDFLQWTVFVVDRHTLHGLECVKAINDLAKDGVLAVQVRLLGVGDEELRFIGVASRIGHCHDSSGIELGEQQEGRKDGWKDKRIVAVFQLPAKRVFIYATRDMTSSCGSLSVDEGMKCKFNEC